MGPVIDSSEDLAGVLGLPLEDFVEIFGARWIESSATPWHDFDSDPSGGLDAEVTPWFISGEPAQLMLRVFGHGVFIAAPEGHWTDVIRCEYQPRDQVYVAWGHVTREAPAHVKRLLMSRRRSFRYCRYCRLQTPPEKRFSDDTCMDCATTWHGIVY